MIKLVIIPFLLVSTYQDPTSLIGIYCYGNGLNMDCIELTEDGRIHFSTFSDYLGRSRTKNMASYEIKGDLLIIKYSKPKYERKLKSRIGSIRIIRKTDRFIALIPESEIMNWDKYLAEFEKMNDNMAFDIPDNMITMAFEEYRILIKSN